MPSSEILTGHWPVKRLAKGIATNNLNFKKVDIWLKLKCQNSTTGYE